MQTREHIAWRKAVLMLAGCRCQAIQNGRRCTAAMPDQKLYADHINERKDGGAKYDVANGQALCARHHALKTNRARAVRMGVRA